MTASSIILGGLVLAASLAFTIAATKWALRQLSADDCCIDLDDCI